MTCALSIPVRPDAAVIEAAARPKHPLLGKLLGGQRGGNGGGHVDLDVHGFTRPLMIDLAAFIRARIPEPWAATRWFLESYLHGIDHQACVRGQRVNGDDSWAWALQLSFSDCAGMANVSMRLAAHWADAWIAERRGFIEERVLAPGGLQATAEVIEVTGGSTLFWPVGELGYAAYSPSPLVETTDGEPEPFHFDIDVACFETDEDGALRTLRFLEDHCHALMLDGRCRCQMCMPDFEVCRHTVPGATG